MYVCFEYLGIKQIYNINFLNVFFCVKNMGHARLKYVFKVLVNMCCNLWGCSYVVLIVL